MRTNQPALALLGAMLLTSQATAQQARKALTPADLRSRLFAIAHDSMMGRAPGDAGDFKATAYIAAEFARIGLKPAGDNGTWFQVVPFFRRAPDPRDTLRVGRTSTRCECRRGSQAPPRCCSRSWMLLARQPPQRT